MLFMNYLQGKETNFFKLYHRFTIQKRTCVAVFAARETRITYTINLHCRYSCINYHTFVLRSSLSLYIALLLNMIKMLDEILLVTLRARKQNPKVALKRNCIIILQFYSNSKQFILFIPDALPIHGKAK